MPVTRLMQRMAALAGCRCHAAVVLMATARSLDNGRPISPGKEVNATALIPEASPVADRLAPPVGRT